jgi:hypothetical protein
VGTLANAERRELIAVAVAVAVSAQGTFVPPMLIFPRKYFHDLFSGDGAAGCIGATTGSGSINEESFVQCIKRFNGHTEPREDDPVLLFLDKR